MTMEAIPPLERELENRRRSLRSLPIRAGPPKWIPTNALKSKREQHGASLDYSSQYGFGCIRNDLYDGLSSSYDLRNNSFRRCDYRHAMKDLSYLETSDGNSTEVSSLAGRSEAVHLIADFPSRHE
jgi:hypothetical protein